MPVTLDENSIRQHLEALVAHLLRRDTKGAEAVLKSLAFERLLCQAPDRSRGPVLFYDLAEDLGPERVHNTGDHVRACQAGLATDHPETALHEAEAALARWLQDDVGGHS